MEVGDHLKRGTKVWILSLIIFLCLVTLAYSTETFTVPPFQEVIRTIGLKEGDTVTGSIVASGGSGNDINFRVTDPNDNTILRYDRVTQTSFSFSSSTTGTYTMHFDNSFSWVSSKSIVLDYVVKSPILGVPQDTFYLILGVIIIAIVVSIIIVVLRRSKKKNL